MSKDTEQPPTTAELPLLDRLGGPHEWGYRDLTDGTFIPDNTPFEAFAEIERLRELLKGFRDHYGDRVWHDRVFAEIGAAS